MMKIKDCGGLFLKEVERRGAGCLGREGYGRSCSPGGFMMAWLHRARGLGEGEGVSLIYIYVEVIFDDR